MSLFKLIVFLFFFDRLMIISRGILLIMKMIFLFTFFFSSSLFAQELPFSGVSLNGSKPAPSEVDKPAPEVDKPAPPEVDKPAPPEVDKPAPSEVDKPAPSEVDKTAPSEVDKTVTPPKDKKVEEFLATQSIIQIYKYDSDRENCDKPVMEPWDMQKILEEANVTILSAQKGYDGLTYSIDEWGCRNYPPRINIFSIPVAFYEAIKGMGFRLCKELEERGGDCHPVSYADLFFKSRGKFFVHVYKYSDKVFCTLDSGVDIKSMEQDLIKAKVVVYQRYRAVDGLSYSFDCGVKTGDMNVYVIEKSGLAKSMSMGYRECAYLKLQGGDCHLLSE